MEWIKSFSAVRLLVTAAVLAGVAVAGYGVYSAVTGSEEVTLAEGEQAVPVRRAEFLRQVTINGSLAFPSAESLVFSTAGTVGQVLVRQGDWVTEGQELASLDNVAVTTLRKGLAQAQRDMQAAQAAYDEAMVSNDDAKDAYRTVFRKWLGITLTEEELDQSPDELLASWGVSLDAIFDPNSRFNDISQGWFAGGLPPNDPDTRWNEQIVYTWMNLAPGTILATCSSGLELADGVLCVQRELEDAWDDLGGADPLDLIMLEADLVLAQAELDEAESRMDGAILVAPMDGIITSLPITAGAKVDAGAAAVRIVEPSVIELEGIVDQLDVVSIHEGDTALVSLDAMPGQILEGTVSSVAASPDDQQGFIGYAVRVRVPAPDGAVFPQGLTGTARVILARQPDVLQVPVNAVSGRFDQPIVRVLDRGNIVEREVVLGDSDDFWTVVLEGLEEGEEVIISGQAPDDGFPGGPGIPIDPGFPGEPGIPRPIPSEPGIPMPVEPGMPEPDIVRPLPAPGVGSGSDGPATEESFIIE
ncbi:MAG: efflux RND transporter periplasmic adaptor subunit [Dehalococcoidia bacterium]